MVINRHKSYSVKEVKRILKPGGIFVTQQVGGRNVESLSRRLIRGFMPRFPHWNLDYASTELKNNSFGILYGNECFPLLRFYDVGAIVYFAKIIEWEFPNFSVDRCFEELCALQQELEEKTCIECYEHRFVIVSKNSM
jgi:SAM-dependent methyltransferase